MNERRPVYEAVTLLGVSGVADKYADSLGEDLSALVDWADEELERRLDPVA